MGERLLLAVSLAISERLSARRRTEASSRAIAGVALRQDESTMLARLADETERLNDPWAAAMTVFGDGHLGR